MSKLFAPKVTVEPVIESTLGDCLSFLEARKETCLFLLGNLSNYGFKLTDEPNSGNYRLLKRGHETVGAFSFSRRGNLLIQTDDKDDYSHEIYEAIKRDNIKLEGILGPWKDCISFKGYYTTIHDGFEVGRISKEWLYSLQLTHIEDMNKVFGEEFLSVRLLEGKDFDQWKALRLAYMKELGLPIQSERGNNARKDLARSMEESKNLWGVFLDKELVSIGGYNARYKDIGQIGGVFTPLDKRCKGYSKLCMTKLVWDSKEIHQLNTLILFTDENNIAAQRVYESLGFRKIGYFGMLFKR